MAHHPKTEQFIRSGLFSDLESFVDLEKRISLIDDEKTKGDAFEVFASGYLMTNPAQMVKNIWPTTKLVPHSVLQHLRLSSNDFGVDGVIQTQSGSYRGYQVKFRTTRPSMTWSEVSSFFGLTDKCDDRLLFCNSDDVSGVAEERKDFLSIRGSDLDHLEKEHFERILAYLTRKTIPHERFSPLPYQKEALEKLEISFKDNRVDRATIISACGTGKTLLALFAAEAHAKKTILVLVPSLALLKQTLLEWLQHTSWNKYDYLCVCSDKTVVLDSDELIVRPTELEFSVTTQVEKVRKFLDHPFNGIKIVLSTYDSSNVVAEAMKKDESFELGIFDEAHKTAGVEGSKYSFALSNENLRIKKRLFLTATPKSYFLDPNKRDADGEPTLRYSMDQPSIYGEVIHKLSFHEAAKRKLICKYKVVISVVISSPNRKKLKAGSVMIHGDKVKASQVATQIALSQSVTSRNLHKIFSFHSNIRSAKSFTSNDGDGIIHHLSKFKTFHVNGAMTTAERDSKLKEFKDSKYGVISNARCLTEGVNVPSVDMVAFMAPKRSKIDIVQAVGRAMRNSEETNKKYGYVFVPLFVEQNTDESIEDAVERTGFEEVWAVLQAMQEQDEVLNEIIHQLSADKQITKGFDPKQLTSRVEIDGPIFILEKLRKSIITRLIDRLTIPWDEMVQVLVLYKKRFHHLRVPIDAPKPWDQLGLWVDKVRSWKRNNHLRIERKLQLDQLGFIWRVDGETLDDTTGLLNEKQFIKESGLSRIAKYRKDKLIIPVGTAMAGPGLSYFYHPKQIPELRKKIGITLENTDGLLNEAQFTKESGLWMIAKYRKEKLIIPVGRALAGRSLCYFYQPKQIPELRNFLGITLENIDGLLNEKQFKKESGLSRIAKYREQKLIIPVGTAITNAGLSYFYHPKQIPELRKTIGITLDNTDGLLNEEQFRKESGLYMIEKYRKDKLIIPVGRAMSATAISYFYHPKQIPELRKTIGITLDNTDGLLNEKQFKKESGLTGIHRYREQKLIIPVGRALAGGGISYFYHPKQIPELKNILKNRKKQKK